MPRHTAPPLTLESTLLIRSRNNARWKELRQRLLHSTRAGDDLLAIEGIHLVEEVLRSGITLETLFLREDTWARVAEFPAKEVFVVDNEIFNQGCATQAPQGVAALVKKPTASLDSLLQKKNPLILILDAIQDPGNLGTILRSAEAFGATGALLLPGTVSPWNQKALRASAGSVFRVPLVALSDPTPITRLRTLKIPIYAAVARDGKNVGDVSLVGPAALLIGNEGAGISAALLAVADYRIQIPCPGRVESLNAAVAASILMYAASQQRSASHPKQNNS